MWNDIVEPAWKQVTIWRMGIACWVTKTTNKHSKYVILTALPLKQGWQDRASVTYPVLSVRTISFPSLIFLSSVRKTKRRSCMQFVKLYFTKL